MLAYVGFFRIFIVADFFYFTFITTDINRDHKETVEALNGAVQQMNASLGSIANTEGLIDELDLLEDSLEENMKNMQPVYDELEDSIDERNKSLNEVRVECRSSSGVATTC